MRATTPWAKRSDMGNGMKLAIKHFRDEAGLTQRECSEAAKMARESDWSNLERPRGTSRISPQQLPIVAEILGVTLSALYQKATELGPDSACATIPP